MAKLEFFDLSRDNTLCGMVCTLFQGALKYCKHPKVVSFRGNADLCPSLADALWTTLGSRLQVVHALPNVPRVILSAADGLQTPKHNLHTLVACAADNLRVLDMGPTVCANGTALRELARGCRRLQAFRAFGISLSQEALLLILRLPELEVLHLGYVAKAGGEC